MNKVVHFEIPSDDKTRAKKFYSDTFDWMIEEMPEIGYTSATTTPADEKGLPLTLGAINGAIVQRSSDTSAPILTISVDSVDAYIKKVEAAGGKAMSPKGEVPEMGFFAYFKDTEGNVVGLWQNFNENPKS